MNSNKLQDLQQELILEALQLKVFKVNAKTPFQWASGYMMPVYNDNRILLRKNFTRKLIVEIFKQKFDPVIWPHEPIFAGIVTAGVPWAVLFAQESDLQFIYVRDKPKDHGMKNQIEGIPADENLGGEYIVMVEDLISTGGSTKKAIEAVRQAGGNVKYCISIFNYGFPEADKLFEEVDCKVISLITFDEVWETALKNGYLSQEQVTICAEWQKDPWNWGEKHGFPKVEKK